MPDFSQTFKPESQTISKVFSCDEIYKIPDYQRQYSWNNEQLEALWSDLYEAYKNKDNGQDCYFLGSIVVVNNGDGYLDLIDGQQRLTTLMIMMSVINKTYPKLNDGKTGPYIVTSNKVKKCMFVDDETRRLQLQTNPEYDTIFVTQIIKAASFESLKTPTKKSMRTDDPTYKYINTAKFFYDKFKELEQSSEKEVEDFINYIFYSTNIIKIECTNVSFAIKLFQVLNDRGLPLSSADIIKSYIIEKIMKINDKNYRDHLEQTFKANWKYVENIANNNDFSLDDFMVFFEYYKLKANPKKQVVDELKDIIQNEKNISDLIDELRNFGDSVKQIYDSTNPVIYSLRYVPWTFYTTTAIASAYYVGYSETDALFKLMRRFFYISWISGHTLNQIKQTSFNLISAIIDKKSIDDIKKIFDESIEKYKMIKSVQDSLNDDVYGESFLKPLLLSIDYDIREKTNTSFIIIDKYLHMDHILPQKFTTNDDWNNIDEGNGIEMLNKLGNMALLLYSKNEEALNHGFDDKIIAYKGLDVDGNNKSGASSFETTRVIISDYDKGDKDWDTDHIKTREKYLKTEISRILDIEL